MSQQHTSTTYRENLVRSLLPYDALYDDIANNHPEGSVRLRFNRLRTIVAAYIEGHLREQERKIEAFMRDVKTNHAVLDDDDALDRFDKLMKDAIELLHLSSRAYDQDARMAQASVVEPHYMNTVWRVKLEDPSNGLLAPNGESKTLYGTVGDPVPHECAAVRGWDNDDFFQRLIVYKLLYPVNQRIRKPLNACQDYLNSHVFGRPNVPRDYGLSGRTLQNIAWTMEGMVAVACVASTAILLYYLRAFESRFIASTILSLVFSCVIIFLSESAIRFFALAVGFWAVTIVLIPGKSNMC